MSHKTLIYNKVIEQVQAASFHPVQDSGRALSVDEDTNVSPGTILVGEEAKTFGDSRRSDRLRQSISSWDWVLVLKFNREVSLEAFEDAWIADVPKVKSTEDTRVIFLYLESVEYIHPERKNDPKGTYARYRIRVEIGPQ